MNASLHDPVKAPWVPELKKHKCNYPDEKNDQRIDLEGSYTASFKSARNLAVKLECVIVDSPDAER